MRDDKHAQKITSDSLEAWWFEPEEAAKRIAVLTERLERELADLKAQ